MQPLPGKISICGKTELDRYMAWGVTHVLSIEDPQIQKAIPPWFKGIYYRLQFHDVEKPNDILGAVPPTREHVQEILKFGSVHFVSGSGNTPHLLVHCAAGACRSPAAAFAILTQYWGEGHAAAALDHVLKVRPEAFPNRLIVKHADDLLGLKGEMLRALAPLRKKFNSDVDEWIASRNTAREG